MKREQRKSAEWTKDTVQPRDPKNPREATVQQRGKFKAMASMTGFLADTKPPPQQRRRSPSPPNPSSSVPPDFQMLCIIENIKQYYK